MEEQKEQEQETQSSQEIEVNGKKISEEEFEQLKESLKNDSSTQLVCISPNKYKTRLFG